MQYTNRPGRGRCRRPVVPWLAAAASVLSACTAGSGEGLDIAGRPLGEGGAVPLAATLESMQANVFDPFCVTCHAGASAPLGLRLDAGSSFNNLVGVRSRQSNLPRVAPGDPDGSYLVRKLEGSASEGAPMPLGGPPLPQPTIDFLRQWILDGALPAASGPPDLPPAVTSIDPAPASTLAALPAEIRIGFDRDLDASTVNIASVLLERSGSDGGFGEGNEVALTPVSVSLAPANPRLVTLDLTGLAGTPDDYRLTVRGTPPSPVLGVNGLALDGEFAGSFPSGDGSEGGDFSSGFSIAAVLPTLESIQTNVFTPSCAVSGCHTGPSGGSLPGGMDLSTADASFDDLVGVASQQVPSLARVAAGDSAASYLVQKLEGNAAVGGRMPAGSAALDAGTIDAIRTWIDNGAFR